MSAINNVTERVGGMLYILSSNRKCKLHSTCIYKPCPQKESSSHLRPTVS